MTNQTSIDRASLQDLASLGPSELLDRLTVPSRLGVKPGLERIRQLLGELGNPQVGLPILHIGGTSGKGSTSTIAAAILREAGYHVGLHVKPHLEAVEERFVVDDLQISSAALAQRLRDVAPVALAMQPSWYELTVAIALQHFRQAAVDVAVIEVGLGGTFDATNVVEPLVATLTNVGLDHTEILGDTVEKIAADKAGILKPGVFAVSGISQPGPAQIVAERCRDNAVSLWRLGEEFRYRLHDVGPNGSRFDVRLGDRELKDLRLSLLGEHQVGNAAIAIASVFRLGERGRPVSEDAVRRALTRLQVAGRLEILRKEPVLVLDGAHNPDKMAALAAALPALFPGRPTHGVLAFKRGHDIASTLRQIAPRLDRVTLTSFDAATDFGRGQAVDPYELRNIYRQLEPGAEIQVEVDPVKAVGDALATAHTTGVVCVTGSLYLAGVIRAAYRHQDGPDR